MAAELVFRRPFSFQENRLFDILVSLFAVPLAGEGFFGSLLFAGFQVEGVTLDLLDDVLLLDLALETAQRAFERLAILHEYFSQ